MPSGNDNKILRGVRVRFCAKYLQDWILDRFSKSIYSVNSIQIGLNTSFSSSSYSVNSSQIRLNTALII